MKKNLKIAVASGCGALIGGSVPFHQNMSVWTVLVGIILGAIFGWILYDHKQFLETFIGFFKNEVGTILDSLKSVVKIVCFVLTFLGLLCAAWGLSMLLMVLGAFSLINSIGALLESAHIWFYLCFHRQLPQDELHIVMDFVAPVVLTLCYNVFCNINDIKFSGRFILLERTWPMLFCPLFFPLVVPLVIGLAIYLAIITVKAGYRTFLYLQSEPRLLVAVSSATGVVIGVIADKYLICGIAGFAIGLLGGYVSRKIAKLGSKFLTNRAI